MSTVPESYSLRVSGLELIDVRFLRNREKRTNGGIVDKTVRTVEEDLRTLVRRSRT